MPSRRGFVRRVGVALVGSVLASSSALASEPAGPWAFDPESAFEATATVTATAGPSALDGSGESALLREKRDALERRIDSVSPSDVDSLTATGGLRDGEPAGCCLVATGEFDADAVRAELSDRGFDAGGAYRGVDRFTGDGEYAVGVADDALLLGHARDADAPLAWVDAALDARAGARVAPDAPLESVLGGDAVATASLDDAARARLRSAAPDDAGPIAGIADALEAVGVAADVGDETTLRYGVAADPDRLDAETVRDAVGRIGGEDGSVEVGSIARRDGAVVAELRGGVGGLLDAHRSAFGDRSGD